MNGISISRSPGWALFIVDRSISSTDYIFIPWLISVLGNDIARDIHCDIIMGHDIAMGTYHDDTMYTDAKSSFIVLQNTPNYDIAVFLVKTLQFYTKHWYHQKRTSTTYKQQTFHDVSLAGNPVQYLCVGIFHSSFILMKYPYTKIIQLDLQTRKHPPTIQWLDIIAPCWYFEHTSLPPCWYFQHCLCLRLVFWADIISLIGWGILSRHHFPDRLGDFEQTSLSQAEIFTTFLGTSKWSPHALNCPACPHEKNLGTNYWQLHTYITMIKYVIKYVCWR